MGARVRLPLWIVAAMGGLVVVVSGNLSGLGIGSGPLLYDTVALPRFAVVMVLATIGWAVWLLAATRAGQPLRWDIVWVLLVALAVWAGVSALTSQHRALSLLGQSERLEGVATVLLYAAVYGLALQVVRDIRDVRFVAAVLGAASASLALFGVLQFLGLDPTSYGFEQYSFATRRAFANFDNPNFFAGLLVLSLPLVVALAITESNPTRRTLWGIGTVAVLLALVATFTRSAWLAALVEITVAGWVFGRGRRGIGTQLRRWALAAMVIVFAVLVVASLAPSSELNVAERIADFGQRGGSAHERLLTLSIATKAAMTRPIVGYGPDAFLPAFRLNRSDAYAEQFGATSTVNNAHSWPIQYAATLGFPGAVILVAAVVAALWRSRRLLRSGGVAATAGGQLAAAIWIGCLGFAIHMLFSVAMIGATVPFWLLLATLGASHAKDHALRKWSRIGAGIIVSGLAIIAVALSVALVSADASYLSSRKAFTAIRPDDALDHAQRARALNPTSVKYARGAAEAAQLNASLAVTRRAPAEAVSTAYKAASTQFDWVIMQSPSDYAARAWLASLQAEVGGYVGDNELRSLAQTTASIAAQLDRQGAEVAPLAQGDLSEASISAAANVPRLP